MGFEYGMLRELKGELIGSQPPVVQLLNQVAGQARFQ